MLQVIVAALLFGFGILAAGEKGRPAAALVDSLTEVCMKVMDIILRLSPIGVFCLILPVVAENGPQILGNLGLVLLCAYIGYFLHAVIVYSATVKALGGVSPLAFFKGMFPAMAMAFSSASSVGTLPLNLGARSGWAPGGTSPASSCPWAPPSTWTAPPSTRACAPCSSPPATEWT